MPLGKILKLLMVGFQQKPLDTNTSELPTTTESIPAPTDFEILPEVPSVVLSETLPEMSSGVPSIVLSETSSESPKPVCEDSGLPTTTSIQTPSSTISQRENMINISMLQDELQTFVTTASDVQGAALVSPDGLALASVLPGAMDEERTAAMSASMLSLGERIGRELARGTVERIVVEGEKGYGVLVGCGSDAVLLVLAGAGVKQGILFLEVKRVVTKLAPLLG
jgi:uncharacterized protein